MTCEAAVTGNRVGDEFELIAKYFAPLAADAPGALGLRDDAALLDLPTGEHLVAATDVVVAGVHFLGDEPAGDIARKVIRVNLSDLAAMGAQPLGLLLAAVLPLELNDEWMSAFAAGLKADTEEFHVPLIGGDTAAGDGPLTLTVTALGAVPTGQELTRGGAKEGDAIYVTGTIGDAALGLTVAKGGLEGLDPSHRTYLLERYHLPHPRLDVGIRLRGIANAAIDVSDGLIADLRHICDCSDVGASLEASSVPLSVAAQAATEFAEGSLGRLLTGGDDYELLFTSPLDKAAELDGIAADLDIDITRIGSMTGGGGLEVVGGEGLPSNITDGGYRHFR